jgi:transcriptional regulator with XRE-family HTH domain
MTHLGISGEQLAARCGVSDGYMEQILRGYKPSKRTLLLMAQALECTVEELLGDSVQAATQ